MIKEFWARIAHSIIGKTLKISRKHIVIINGKLSMVENKSPTMHFYGKQPHINLLFNHKHYSRKGFVGSQIFSLTTPVFSRLPKMRM